LNIHPGLLPAFPGVDAQQQAFHHGVQIAGVTVHLVNEGCDTGPILAQAATGVQPTDDAATLQARLLRMEHEIYPMVLQWAAEGRIEVHDSTASVDLPRNHTRFLWREPE
jgi:phosphoribosylglycinamide formyltransferase-1